MATADDFRRAALALEGTVEAPHMDRRAFKVARTYATLAADGLSANFKFSLDEQELKCLINPGAFAPVPKGWGRMGWTTGILSELTSEELQAALQIAWQHALPRKRAPARRRS